MCDMAKGVLKGPLVLQVEAVGDCSESNIDGLDRYVICLFMRQQILRTWLKLQCVSATQ